MNRSNYNAHASLIATASLDAANRRTMCLLAAGVAEARRLKAARSGRLVRFWRMLTGAR